jgi:hypothetical protein
MESFHVILEYFYSTKWTLSASYRVIGSNKTGMITNVYGPRDLQEKETFLENLIRLGDLIGDRRWILGGDFNLIKYL